VGPRRLSRKALIDARSDAAVTAVIRELIAAQFSIMAARAAQAETAIRLPTRMDRDRIATAAPLERQAASSIATMEAPQVRF
jgi:hypothetical protein